MARDPVPDRPHVHSNAYPWLKVPGSRECAHRGILGWNPTAVGLFYAQISLKPCLQDIRERSMTGKITIEEKWLQQSETAKSEAEKLPYGKEREALVRKARQLHTASQINEWLSSPGLQPPK